MTLASAPYVDHYVEAKYGQQLFVADATERERLESLERVYDAGSSESLRKIGIKPYWRCLELGAGAGSLGRWLAEQVPAGSVVATDIDTRFLRGVATDNLRVLR